MSLRLLKNAFTTFVSIVSSVNMPSLSKAMTWTSGYFVATEDRIGPTAWHGCMVNTLKRHRQHEADDCDHALCTSCTRDKIEHELRLRSHTYLAQNSMMSTFLLLQPDLSGRKHSK